MYDRCKDVTALMKEIENQAMSAKVIMILIETKPSILTKLLYP